MKCKFWFLPAIMILAGLPLRAEAGISLGSSGNFAVLAGTSVTNANSSVIDGGDVGATTSITGFPPGTVTSPYTTTTQGSVVNPALADLTTAYMAAKALTPTMALTGQDLGGLTLTPGVYSFASSAQLTGTLTLDDQGNPDAQFVFQIGSTLITASDAKVVTIDGGSMPGSDVFWQVGSSATIGTGTAFEGHLLADVSITLNAGASIMAGSALAIMGSVTLDTNTIHSSSIPEPATMTLATIGIGLLGLPALAGRLRRLRARDDFRPKSRPAG